MFKPVFFPTPAKFNAWLKKNHATKDELIVGFYKKDAGKPSVTWPESVDEALCFGWIDGIRRRVDDEIYTIRFTPRRPNSNWSARNIERVAVLTKEKRMQPAGIREFKKRKLEKTYAYEQDDPKLDKNLEKKFKSRKDAWEYFQSLPKSIWKPSIWWVATAKKEETRLRRLEQLIDYSSKQEILPQFLRPPPKTPKKKK